MFGERQQEQIARELNSKNLRTKSFDGNRWGSDGYSGDRYYDGMIIKALDSTSSEKKILTNQGQSIALGEYGKQPTTSWTFL